MYKSSFIWDSLYIAMTLLKFNKVIAIFLVKTSIYRTFNHIVKFKYIGYKWIKKNSLIRRRIMAGLKLKGINKIYPNGYHAVKDVNFEIQDKEFVVLVGPSGCGKSTTLRMIAGLEEISDGELYIGDKVVNDIHPKDRDIAMVFQNYAL